VLTVGIGVSVTWLSLLVAYHSPYPVGFYLTSFAFAVYLIGGGLRRLRPEPAAGEIAAKA
jgi:zinc/manganese transport system permease protein